MIAELGNAFLYLALANAVLLAVEQALDGLKKGLLQALWIALFCLIAGSMLCLIYCYAVSDFTVLSVVNNSHTSKPMLYKITAAWASHEGSMLLWIASIAVFTLAFAYFSNSQDRLIRGILMCQAWIISFFLLFTIFTSNPFTRIFPAPLNGYGLNPVLQDIGLAMHPPALYLGYVSFSLTYSAALAGLALGRIDASWAKMLRPWTLISWSTLTIGIGLGSWWAYRELGWGGFWFWDPVENASLMPWLLGTALIHALVECERYNRMRKSAALLAAFTFVFSMIGTFIVRSGLVTSVHSFASDPKRGLWILLMLLASIAAVVILYALNGKSLGHGSAKPENRWRTVLLLANNLLLMVLLCMVALGTLYPIAINLLGLGTFSIGAAYYNTLGGMLTIPLLLFASLASSLPLLHGHTSPAQFWVRHRYPAWTAIILTLLLNGALPTTSVPAIIAIFSALFLISNIVQDFLRNPNNSRIYAMTLAHSGVALMLLAISINASGNYSGEKIIRLGESQQFHGFDLALTDVYAFQQENYIAKAASIQISSHATDGFRGATLYPEIRLYPVEQQQTSEAAILHRPLYDLYVSLIELEEDGTAVLRIYYKPMIGWLWLGCALIAMGGVYRIISIVLRRVVY